MSMSHEDPHRSLGSPTERSQREPYRKKHLERPKKPKELRAAKVQPPLCPAHLGLSFSLHHTFLGPLPWGPYHRDPHQSVLLPGWGLHGLSQGTDWVHPGLVPQSPRWEHCALALAVLTADQMPHLECSMGWLLPHLSSMSLVLDPTQPSDQLTYKEREMCPGQASSGYSGLWLQPQVSQHLHGVQAPH